MDSFSPVVQAYRFYDDDAGEAASTPLANQDTNITVNLDGGNVALQLRELIQNTTAVAGAAGDDYALQFSINGGAFATVTGATTGVIASTSGLTNDGATTNRATNGITDGTGSFVAGEQCTDGTLDNHALTASNFTEHVWGVTLVAADLSDGDVITFRTSLNGGAPGMTNSVTPTITADITAPTFDGEMASTLPAVTTSGAGVLRFVGAAAITLAALTSSGTGTHDQQATDGYRITPELNRRVTPTGDARITAGVIQPVTATGAVTLPAATVSGAGKLTFAGTASIVLPAVTVSGDGTYTPLAITGTGAVTLPAVTSSGAGKLTFAGTGASTLPSVTVSGDGAQTFSGTGAVTLPSVTASGAGKLTFTATSAVTLPAVTVSGEGTTESTAVTGTGDPDLRSITVSGSGSLTFAGEGATTLPSVTVSGSGALGFSGSGASTLPAVTVSGAGKLAFTGSGAITLPSVTVSGDGTYTPQAITGTGAITLASLTVSGVGTHDTGDPTEDGTWQMILNRRRNRR